MEYQPDPKNIAGTGGQISCVEPGSTGAALGLRPGDRLLAVNDLRLRDVIDYRFAIADEHVRLLLRRDGADLTLTLDKDPDDDLGLDFTEPLFDRLRTCNNKCPFCFLTQMPKGMRKTLYLKDDDYRLSFLYGNFVTLTNLSEDDWQRIETQRLSPLYISIHATDRALRAVLLGKKDVDDVLPQLERLARAGIQLHTQVVACPGVNDTPAALHRTITDLAAFYPAIESISVVPVGLTRFRFSGKAPKSIRAAIEIHETDEWINTNWELQPRWDDTSTPATPEAWGFCSRLAAATDVPLRCFTPAEAARMIDLLEPYTAHYNATLGAPLVFPSDEFYLLCGRELPPADFYADYPQYSNGVGMTREFLDAWTHERTRLPRTLATPVQLGLVCGTLIAPVLRGIAAKLNQIENLDVRVLPVTNEFFGETVTVSGLLTGQDVVPVLRASGCTHALLPRVMFDHQGLRTIDEYSPEQISAESGVAAHPVEDAADLVRAIRQFAAPASRVRRQRLVRARMAVSSGGA